MRAYAAALLLAALPACARAQDPPGPLIVDVDAGLSLPLRGGVHGFNLNQASGVYGFADSAFVALIEDLRPGMLRFPGGSESNLYHWRIGGFREDELSLTGPSLEQRHREHARRLARRQDGRIDFDEYMALCRRFGIAPVIVVNVFSGTPEESAAWVAHVRERGWQVAGWELGNELYRPGYREVIPDPETYVSRARAHARAMRAVDPAIRLGLVGSPAAFHLDEAREYERRWDEVIGRADFGDAVSAHVYFDGGRAVRDAAGLARLIDDARIRIDGALDYYAGHYGARPIWLTEWNLGGHRSPALNTVAHALFVAAFEGVLLAEPRIELAGYHSLTGPGAAFALLSPAADGTAARRAASYAFELLGGTISDGTALHPVTVPSPASGFAVRGERTLRVLLVNPTPSALPLELRVSGERVPGDIDVRAIAGAQPAAALPTRDAIRTWRGPALDLVLAPWSVSLVEVPWP